MKASKTLDLPPVVQALMDKWEAEKQAELRKKLTEDVAEYKYYSVPTPTTAVADVLLVDKVAQEVIQKLKLGDVAWCDELQVYGEIDRLYFDNGIETAAFSWQDGCKCAIASLDSLVSASGPPTFDPEWKSPEADFEPLPIHPPEVTDEWLAETNLRDMAETLTICEEGGLVHLRKVWPRTALNEACKFISEEKKEQIKQWVTTQNIKSTLNLGQPEAIAIPDSFPRESPTLEPNPPSFSTNGSPATYHLITDAEALVLALKPLQAEKILAVDTETTGLDPHLHKIRLVQIAAPNQPVVLVDLSAITPNELEPLRQLLQGPAIKIAQNWKFDWQFLMKAGLKPSAPFFDTMLASQLLTAGLIGGHSLQAIAKTYLGIDLDKEQQTSNWTGELKPEQLDYAAKDAAILLELRQILRSKLLESGLEKAAKLEFQTIPAVAEIELNGMLLDLSKWESLSREMVQSKAKAKAELAQQLRSGNPQVSLLADFDNVDPDSPKQVLEALQALGVPVKSTGKNALIPLAGEYPVIKILLEYRGFAKMVSAFTEKLPTHINPVTGRIHASYNQYGAATGRFSVNNPNLQQVPRRKEVRACFIPAPGYKFVVADYSQIELRVAAEISCDHTMINAYQKGEDLHKLTASLITGKPLNEISKSERQAGKPVNFGLIYGCGAKKLGETAENDYGVVKSLAEWEAYRTKFFDAYSGIAKWHKRLIRERPMEMRTLSGRRRQWTEQPWVTATSNTVVQGTAADIAKRALALLPAALEITGARLIGTIHDEILLEVPEANAKEAAKILKATMEAAGKEYLKLVPVEAEASVMDSWGDK